MTQTIAKIIAPIITIFFTKLSICNSNGVFSSFILSKLFPILPNFVSFPIAFISTIADPLAADVPLKTK